ncbi:hypothetical protein SPRG_06257 [Saprolegnia parasitica CBS 223.65]|uniref:Uncharacterized protein n=1 Tax=Saprolegnia parasitica (strain CBS 223.65) TaxID=695850 RepID=A0A067CCM4_SAPPC|nr:hypothetical protein SPRG_06257 [Saprolegnia parasitica CBS 223.65]KDO28208.1 hypothetical protein SPRG_06257 [Saprolegnia parasitica CBS 223.65]|eukprot:XP_012201033.1 hypothetical protein SPRG_06257 [Saprolegnia parasitica CBS 223.65]
MSCKRVRPCETKNVEGLSLAFKLRSLVVEAHLSDLNASVIEKNLVAIANELATLCAFGIQPEDRCVRFLVMANDRIAKMLAKKDLAWTASPHAIWSLAKAAVLGSKPGNVDACYAAEVHDISVLWHEMLRVKDKAADLWKREKLEEALPYLHAADAYFKRIHLKHQKLNIDHAIIDCHVEPVAKKAKAHRVSFSDTPLVLGTAQADVDRTPICPSKPTQLEALLLRATREFPMPCL